MTISIVHCNLEWDGNSRCAALATYMMPNANVKRFYDIILVMQLAHKKWLLRCNHIHENDIRNRSIESENLLEHTINEFLHSIKRDLLLEDQQYFDLHVENYLAGRSFKYNKTWCIHYNKFVPGTKTRAKRKLRSDKTQRDICKFLTIPTDDKYHLRLHLESYTTKKREKTEDKAISYRAMRQCG